MSPLIEGYHAHIYFTENTFSQATRLQRSAARDLGPKDVFVSRLVGRPIGPHPTPMFEMDFDVSQRDEVVDWIERHREGLSVLVHEVTGDDYRDHTEGVLWLGEPVILDLSKMNPDNPTVVRKK